MIAFREIVSGVRVDNVPNEVGCFLRLPDNNVYPDSVYRVENITLRDQGANNWQGEVGTVLDSIVYVSYDYGQPWGFDDVVEVDYKFDPISDYHLTPVEVRYERTQVIDFTFIELRYRTALTTFSYYFMDYEGTKAAWVSMLNWFLNPNIQN